MTKIILPLLAGLIALSVSNVMVATDAEAGSSDPVLAPLLGFSLDQSDLHFSVLSNGCTSEADFVLEYDESPEFDKVGESMAAYSTGQTVYVRLIRLKEDKCRRRPLAQLLSLPVKGPMIGHRLQLINPFIPTVRVHREK